MIYIIPCLLSTYLNYLDIYDKIFIYNKNNFYTYFIIKFSLIPFNFTNYIYLKLKIFFKINFNSHLIYKCDSIL